MSFTPDVVRDLVRRKPFVPLQLVTTTGESYTIDRPDMVFLTIRSLMLGTPSRRNPLIADDMTHVALVNIDELRELDLPAASVSNSSE